MNSLKIENIEQQIKILFDQWVEEREKQIESSPKIRYSGPKLDKDDYGNMLDAIFKDWWSGGGYTIKAERKLAEVSQRNHGLLANSGSSANLMLMAAAKELYFKDGDKILTLSCGFPTTVNPIITNRLRPLFVDIDIDTLNLSADTLEKALEWDKEIKGVFVAHTLGFHDDIDAILDVARKYNVQVFFDCCDAYGTTYKYKPIQKYGKAATFSFYVAHHITMGEGGGVVTNDDDLHLLMRSFRGWGRYCALPECCVRSERPDAFCPPTKYSPNADLPEDYMVNYQFEFLGYNLKPLDLQAAILLSQLDKLDKFGTERRRNYFQLKDYFRNNNRFNFKLWDCDNQVSPFAFPLMMPKDAPFQRKHLINHLKINKIESRVLFGGNLMRHPAYMNNSSLWNRFGEHKNSDEIVDNFLMLGVSQVNNRDRTQRIIECIDDFLKGW